MASVTKCTSLAEEREEHPEVGRSLLLIARVYEKKGDPDRAQEYRERGLAHQDQLAQLFDPLIARQRAQGAVTLAQLIEDIPGCVRDGLVLEDSEIGSSEPGLAIASALHETQYARLFRA